MGIISAVILLLAGLLSPLIPYQKFDNSIKIFGEYITISNYGDLGSYIGGITTPFLSLAGLILLFKTYKSQAKELKLTRDEMRTQNVYASNNLTTSIKKQFIETATEYSHGCNVQWRSESTVNRSTKLNILSVTEIIISIEVMGRLVEIYTEFKSKVFIQNSINTLNNLILLLKNL